MKRLILALSSTVLTATCQTNNGGPVDFSALNNYNQQQQVQQPQMEMNCYRQCRDHYNQGYCESKCSY